MSGHNKWSKIHRKKGLADAERGNIYARLSKEILVAVKQGGSGDPAQNSKLREALNKARSNNMPNDNVKRAISKALGDATVSNYERITYEGYGPAGVAVMVEALTNNKNRTAGDIRSYFDKSGGGLGVSGAVSYMFREQGIITIDPNDAFNTENEKRGTKGVPVKPLTDEELLEILIDAPIDDISTEDGIITVSTKPENFDMLLNELERHKIKSVGANIEWVPTITVSLPDDKTALFERLIENLEGSEDVQAVYHNAE
jgi:YebC/PmpR family DNA-binding regulatory protein